MENLRDMLNSLLAKEEFTPGQLVKWKPNMKNKRCPEYDEVAIVVEVLSEPIVDHRDDPGTAYYREPLDIIIGMIDPDGDLITYHYDSRRFTSAERTH